MLVRGRGFTLADGRGAPNVAVVSEDVAASTWPGEDPLGKRIKFGGLDSAQPWLTVVGVARPTRYGELARPRATLYLPAEQFVAAAEMFALRTTSPGLGEVRRRAAGACAPDPGGVLFRSKRLGPWLARRRTEDPMPACPSPHARRGPRPLVRALVFALPILTAGLPVHAQDDAALKKARAILRRVPLVDGHNDTPWLIRETAESDVSKYDLRKRTAHETDLARLREGQVGAQFWSVWIPSVDSGSARMQLEQIDLAHRMISAYPEALVLATRAADVAAARRAGKIASFLGMENGRALENSLGPLRAYYDLGVRYMTLTHGRRTDWADSATDEATHKGLTPFGKEVVREMNRLGMLVDISHVSPAVMHQALDVSEAPVLFSHSSAFAVTPHPRNVPDGVLRRLAQNGGVVMITFIPAFVSQKVMDWEAPLMARLQGATNTADMERLEKEHEKEAGPKPKATLKDVADHVDHAAKVAGVDHVGIGSDFAGVGMPEGLEDTSRYPHLFAELIRRGWKDADLEKLAGANVVRALAQAEKVAARLQRDRPPSTATLEALDGARP